MTNINAIYTSNYLTAADLAGQEPTVTITSTDIAKMNDGQAKLCIFVNNRPKGIVLNKTNARAIADMYGPESDGWIGKRVKLVTVWTDYQGKPVQAVRIVPPGADTMQQRGPAPIIDGWEGPTANGGATTAPVAPVMKPPGAALPPGHPEFTDEIPF